MNIEKVVVGELEENCYILSIENYCLVIDPGNDEDKIIDIIKDKKVLGILLTHHHFDHVGAVDTLVSKYDTKVYDFSNLDEGNISIGPFTFEVIYNPGHSKDSISFYFKEIDKMFVGDFVFLGSIGRCDLPTGNFKEMQDSINRLKKFKENITLYPGHGMETTLNFEKENNPFF